MVRTRFKSTLHHLNGFKSDFSPISVGRFQLSELGSRRLRAHGLGQVEGQTEI